MNHKHVAGRLLIACGALVSGCGGGGGGSTSAPAAGPAVTDSVLFSNTLASDGITATISQAGIIRAVGTGSQQGVTFAAGTTPLTGDAALATGDGWLKLPSGFAAGTVTLKANSDGNTYTLSAANGSTQASNPVMAVATNLVTPTLAALAGNYGITSSWSITISGDSVSGTYGYNCTWSGTLTPRAHTIDVLQIQFATAGQALNPAGNACPYAGKTYTGTAFLMGPSAAYAKGAFDIIFDDSASGMPTSVNLFNFIRQ